MANFEMEIDRLSFLSTLYKAQGVVDRKSTINVLSHLHLEHSGEGVVHLTGTDYDVVLQASLNANVTSGGSTCINGRSLFDVVKNLDAPTVNLKTLDNNWVEVTAGRSRYKLAGISADEFPAIASPVGVSWLGIPKALFKDLIDKTAFSVSDEETRMNLNGVFFKIEPGAENLAKLSMVSTDGHRLSRIIVEAEVAGYEGQTHEAIVHKKGVQEVRRLLEDSAETVDVGFARGHVLLRVGQTTLTVRQIEDSYPDYERVIPSSSSSKVEIGRQQMIQSIRRLAILTSSKTYIVKMDIGSGRLAFTTSNPDYGEGVDELDIAYDGPDITVGFNYAYILDVLGVLKGETICLECSDSFSPMVITSPSEQGALFVVMPMRI
jgi:DNA polymerase-3 subunit beta